MKTVAAQMGIDTAELVFPEMAAGAEAEREGDGAWSVGPALAIGIPVFDFGQARTAAGKAQLRKLWDDYTALAIEIRSAARSAKYRLVNARQQADYYQQVIVPLSEQIALETQLQYNAMQLGVFQLLQAKQMQYAFQRNYIKALRNYWIARTEIQLLLDGHLVRQTLVDLSTGGQMMMDSGGH
jgi:outer membrane protein TolC